MRKMSADPEFFFKKIFHLDGFHDAERFILLASRPFGACAARITRNERKDAVTCDPANAIPCRLKSPAKILFRKKWHCSASQEMAQGLATEMTSLANDWFGEFSF